MHLDGTLSPMTHLIFGANTDVGKTVVTTGLVKACQTIGGAHYVKPLQCGGSDEDFVTRHVPDVISTTTLFEWETPTSPHTAARLEKRPVDDCQVVSALHQCIEKLKKDPAEHPIWVETAGGVLSPSSSSPDNTGPHHASNKEGWGWIPQGDLYREFQKDMNVVMIGDGRLGGISASLSSLESLLSRGYNVVGVILLEAGYANQTAIREYAARCVKTAVLFTDTVFMQTEGLLTSPFS